ncbi:DNA topoisomerase IB [Bradyrhizobium sp.]|uniref:DNA topoisomerase IB n=1 Tax=Bradyrhizobium sp. TaxID=376 RepID=UPI001EBDEDBA|nr:DNA topoisomerase IB [Bradyrhizobium sp.]MBV9979123.1 DNA topoisomerase IB [Bradyrhizobium sp.]
MMDQLNYETKRSDKADPEVALAKALGQWPPAPSPRDRRKIDPAKIDLKKSGAGAAALASVEALARELGLKLGEQNELTIRRIKRGKGYAFIRANGAHIRDAKTIRRLHAMAVPPAYREVRYAVDPTLHLQAVGIDAAGRLQYRYHADWEKVREHRKAHRLAKLVGALPKIRRKVTAHLSGEEPTREFALAAVIELIARTAIRPGSESYARLNGTRGAATLLKSNVTLEDDSLVLTFKAKGGKAVRKECNAAKLVRAVRVLRTVPGKRMFQYRDAQGVVRTVSTVQVNAFLREIAGIKISLKDFRTLMASAVALESLSRVTPAASARGRKRQVLEAVRAAAGELANTPAICRKSYVHDTIVTAFEDGILERFAATMKGQRSQTRREQLLAQVVMAAAV